jgi:major membrane immunogen (membrane-anchored lipoprotein)
MNQIMKPTRSLFTLIFLSLSILSFSQSGLESDKKTKVFPYRDGVYTGTSQSEYTSEPYWGKVRVTVDKGVYSAIKFEIRDSSLHENFNLDYAKHFAGNDAYIQQTKNDWNGVVTYPAKLLHEQEVDKVDAISGATWSYKIFKASLLDALSKAGR